MLVRDKVDPSTLCASIGTLGVSLKKQHQDFINEQLLSVNATITLHDLWLRLNQYWDFLNYTLLEHIIESFGHKNLQSQIESYVSDLREFRKSTYLCDFVDCWSKKGVILPETELHEFVVKMERNWKDCTLEDLEELKQLITHKFFLPSFAFILKEAKGGSFIVTWLIPEPIARSLRDDIENMGEREFLKKNQIDRITINGHECYYSPIKKYAAYLKEVYSSKQGKNIAPFKLARIEKVRVDHQAMDNFTRSSIRGDVDDVVYEKYPLTEDKIGWTADRFVSGVRFKPKHAKLVLIEGAPGVGKTTFSSQFCYRWSQGEVLQQYSLLVLLPLRDNRVRSAQSISDLFFHSQLQQTLEQEVKSSQGEGVALWLEGLDELEKDLCTRSSLFLDLIHGRILPKATVFVTSRPWASQEIAEKLSEETDQHIELLTTPKIQMDRVLREGKMSTSLSEKFVEYTSSNAAIMAAMHTPITANIAADVFEWTKETDSSPPNTMTQLYTTFTCKLLTQDLSNGKDISKQWKLQRFDELPPDIYKQFLSLCKLAYNGITKNQLVFSNLSPNFQSLGLMEGVEQLYREDHTQQSFNFIHLILQEFLAAFHISQLSPKEQNELIHKHLRSNHFKMTLRFLAGITKLAHIGPDLTSQLLKDDKLTFFHWLFEAGNTTIVASILGNDQMSVESSYSWTPLDFCVTGYVLSLSNCVWDLKFWCFIDDDGLRMFSSGVLLNGDAKFSGCISNADFGGNDITEDGIRWFVQLPQRVLQGLVELNLSWNKLDKAALILLAKDIPVMTSLEKLDLSYNSISNGGCVELLQALSTNNTNTTLRHLDLKDTGIGEEDSIALGGLLACSNLTELRINNMSSDSVMYIMNGLSKNNSLEDLHMESSEFTSESAAVLSSVLQRSQCKLKKLDIQECKITSELAIQVAQELTSNHSLKELDLSDNSIGDDGAVALAQGLANNHSLKELDLSDNSISDDGAVALAQGLTNNHSLKELNLSDNSIGDEGAVALAQGLTNNHSLKELDLSDNPVGDDGAVALADMLSVNEYTEHMKWNGYKSRVVFDGTMNITLDGIRLFLKLTQRVLKGMVKLDLSRNKLDKAALSLLAKAIPAMTSLEKLDISDNSISNGGCVELLQALSTNNTRTTLRHLDLSDTRIGEEDSVALGDLLACSNLTELKINNMSSESVMSIMNSLSKNNSLEDLHMRRSEFTSESAAILSSVLHQPQCKLNELDIQECNITSELAAQIAQGLTNNHSLKELDLSDNPIGDDGAVALADMQYVSKYKEFLEYNGCNSCVVFDGTRKIYITVDCKRFFL